MNYKKPAILDVKMGQRTYDPAASETKKAKESAKYPPQSSLGFRILGYRVSFLPPFSLKNLKFKHRG